MVFDTSPDQQVRRQLLKLSSDLGWLAKAENKRVGALLVEAGVDDVTGETPGAPLPLLHDFGSATR